MTYAIVFPGQGSQIVGMGKELYEAFPVARAVFQEVDDVLNQKLSKLMFEGSLEELTLTSHAQPALMAVSMAVVRVLEKEGNVSMERFQVAAGHSLGEYSALAAAGSLTLAQAARLLRIRGEAMQQAVPVGKGAMVAVLGASLSDLEKITREASKAGLCVIANDNSEGQVVLSGEKCALDLVPEIAKNYGVRKCIPLTVSAPFHCALMQPAAEAMEKALAPIHFQDPILPIIPNITAQKEIEGDAFKSLLVKQVTGQVRWRETMETMKTEGVDVVFELGVGKVLSGLFKRAIEGVQTHAVHTPHDIEAALLTLKV
jgi:[acyl-carrier-protein] S-malonyltransferase